MRAAFGTGLMIKAVAACALALTPALLAAAMLPSSEGYRALEVRGYEQFWVLPGVKLGAYARIQVTPVTVQFSDRWMRRYNRDQRHLARRLEPTDLEALGADLASEFDQAFPQELTDAGLQTAGENGAGHLRIEPRLIDVRIKHPDLPTPGRSDVLVESAGQATLILHFRDSQTQRELGWALERRETRDNQHFRRANRVFNRVEFRHLFQSWGQDFARHLSD